MMACKHIVLLMALIIGYVSSLIFGDYQANDEWKNIVTIKRPKGNESLFDFFFRSKVHQIVQVHRDSGSDTGDPLEIDSFVVNLPPWGHARFKVVTSPVMLLELHKHSVSTKVLKEWRLIREESTVDELCDNEDLMDGQFYIRKDSWILDAKDLYHDCPSTKNLYDLTTKDVFDSYSCNRYHATRYTGRDQCRMSSLHVSLALFKKMYNLGGTVAIAGDSLSMLVFISAACETEKLGLADIKLYHTRENMFRYDIPCSPKCTDESFRRPQQNGSWIFNAKCAYCNEDGSRKDTSLIDKKAYAYWFKGLNLPPDTKILLIGTGAWYNLFQGYMNSNDEYATTLRLLAPVLQDLIEKDRIDVYWTSLPPMLPEDLRNSNFEWQSFPEKNRLAKEILEPAGVVVLDFSEPLASLKSQDPHFNTKDKLHWCVPGPFAVPTFQFAAALHLHTLKFSKNLLTVARD